MKRLFSIAVLLFLVQSAFSQTYNNTAPNGSTWYKLKTRGRHVVQINGSGDYAHLQVIAHIVSGSYNTAEYTILSEYNYNHKQIEFKWGYIGNQHDRYLAIKTEPTPNASYSRGFTITDISDPSKVFELELITDPGQVVEIGPHNMVYVKEHQRKVGIGTTDPQTRLHVSTGTNGDAVLKIEADTDNSNEGDNARIELVQDGGSLGAKIGMDQSWPSAVNAPDNLFRIVTRYANVDRTDAFVIDNSNGNIGIGTANPGQKLEVNGTIRSKEVKVEANNWPDYVFADDYQLTTLEETAQYIQQNRHLPEVPSAIEMEANGVELGEMNMLLLKKIEELTLHLIEQQELIKEQNERIEKLENQIK
ncbi:hypothetical protein [Reichenbachiella ulvae]|uniref:Uncharacterized protein n=1 Tax=Reichenbachiella ulvae TaxID=2980104 RepID=A0ABT3CUS0_9BACT|nr:hypothetical protein [Reichenbachiella ulvae]MCV9387441.1 hypothetical protein [Reichenbachiella ulvae]